MKLLFKIFILILLTQSVNAGPKLKSLILPGWGEASISETNRAGNFFLREAILWVSVIGGKSLHSWYKQDYEAFGTLHADVDFDGKDYIFAVNMGHYDSMEEYNHDMSRQRADYDDFYSESKGENWEWDSKANRLSFDKMRITSANSQKVANFAIAGLIVHRIISVIDVLYLERKSGKYNFSSEVVPKGTSGMELQLQLTF